MGVFGRVINCVSCNGGTHGAATRALNAACELVSPASAQHCMCDDPHSGEMSPPPPRSGTGEEGGGGEVERNYCIPLSANLTRECESLASNSQTNPWVTRELHSRVQ